MILKDGESLGRVLEHIKLCKMAKVNAGKSVTGSNMVLGAERNQLVKW